MVQLSSDSAQAWQDQVTALFESAMARGGETKLIHDASFQFVKHGEAKVVDCPAGSEVFFPDTKPPMSQSRANIRSTACCVIYTDDVHVTLTLIQKRIGKCVETTGVDISYRRLRQPALT